MDLNAYQLAAAATAGIARNNLEKLARRYPNGFNSQDSINRKE